MLNLEILGSLATQLHEQFRTLFYVCLPVFFLVSLVITWFKNPVGGFDFVEAFKRVVIASLLMASFQETSSTILSITNGLSAKIGDMQGLDSYMQMISEKAKSYPNSPMTIVLAIDDFFMAILSYGSYLILYFARSFMVAAYQFTWMFLTIMSPILLLFHVFTSKITINLYKSLIEVSSWQIVWSVLAAMLKALPYGNWTAAQDGYLTLIILNFIIAICLFLTPLLINAIVGGSFSAVAGTLAPIAVTTIAASHTKVSKVGSAATFGREALSGTATYVRNGFSHSPRSQPHKTNLSHTMAPSPLQSGGEHATKGSEPSSPGGTAKPTLHTHNRSKTSESKEKA